MSKILYDTTTGNVLSVFDDSQVVSAPSGHAVLTDTTPVADASKLHVDISVPALEVKDYFRHTGTPEQDINTVAAHGVQKVDGTTDVDMANPTDNEIIKISLGNEDMVPGSGSGFTAEPEDQLINGAAIFNLSAGANVGTEYLHIKAAGFEIAKKEMIYL